MKEKSTMWWSSMLLSTLTSVNGLRWNIKACFGKLFVAQYKISLKTFSQARMVRENNQKILNQQPQVKQEDVWAVSKKPQDKQIFWSLLLKTCETQETCVFFISLKFPGWLICFDKYKKISGRRPKVRSRFCLWQRCEGGGKEKEAWHYKKGVWVNFEDE